MYPLCFQVNVSLTLEYIADTKAALNCKGPLLFIFIASYWCSLFCANLIQSELKQQGYSQSMRLCCYQIFRILPSELFFVLE